MVVQKTLNNLKDRSHEDKKAVATGIAISVVVLLIIAWGFLFIRKMQRSDLSSLQNAAVPSDQFNMNLIRDTERELSNQYDTSGDDLREMRDTAAQNSANIETGYSSGGSSVSTDTSDQFGAPGGM